jgi:hypothetical protein
MSEQTPSAPQDVTVQPVVSSEPAVSSEKGKLVIEQVAPVKSVKVESVAQEAPPVVSSEQATQAATQASALNVAVEPEAMAAVPAEHAATGFLETLKNSTNALVESVKKNGPPLIKKSLSFMVKMTGYFAKGLEDLSQKIKTDITQAAPSADANNTDPVKPNPTKDSGQAEKK